MAGDVVVEDEDGDQVDQEPQPLHQDHLAAPLQAGVLKGLRHQEHVGPSHEEGVLVPFGFSPWWQGAWNPQVLQGGGNYRWGEEKDKDVREKDGEDVEQRKLSLDVDAEGEGSEVGDGRGD